MPLTDRDLHSGHGEEPSGAATPASGRRRAVLADTETDASNNGARARDGRPAPRVARTGAAVLAWARRLPTTWTGQAILSAVTVAVLLHLRYGYNAGHGDHLPLSPLGMQWAEPDWFRNDWATEKAVQPHWAFDVVTWFGVTIGALAAVYLLYWLLGLLIFGYATAMLARASAPRTPALAVLAVTVASAVTPTFFLGAGPILMFQALPILLGGALLMVTVAALLTERYRLAAAASVAVAMIHVQHGTISVVLILAVAAWMFLRHRRLHWMLLASGAASLAIILINLKARPVVGNLADFAEVCASVVPIHCEASAWPRADLRGGAALVLLALLTVVYLPRERRHLWAIVVALPAVGLLAGVGADWLNVPNLGVLAQGVNVYRLAAPLLLLAVWGAFTPLFADLSPRRRWAVLGVVLVLGHSALNARHWAVEPFTGGNSAPWMLVFGGALVLGVVAQTVPGLVRTPARLVQAAVWATVACVLISASFAGGLTWKPFDPRVFPQDDLGAWGEQAQREVPSGATILGAPSSISLRMITKRAVVVDCKYVAYGGGAWQEWKARIDALGGIEMCSEPGFGDLPGSAIEAAAKTYRADYVAIGPGETDQIDDLQQTGWQIVLEPIGEAGFMLLRAPWAP